MYEYQSILGVNQYVEAGFYSSVVAEEIDFLSKSRSESYTGNILYFMSGIDLSMNKLAGPIPPELEFLSDIHTLNLSHNQMNSSIPRTFSNLKQIQSLDLSDNKLSGEIPSDLVQLNFLSVFSVANNNLSGRTRIGRLSLQPLKRAPTKAILSFVDYLSRKTAEGALQYQIQIQEKIICSKIHFWKLLFHHALWHS